MKRYGFMRTSWFAVLAVGLLSAALFLAVNKDSRVSAQTSCDTSSTFGTITQNVTVPSTTTYKAWVRLWVPSGSAKSVKLSAGSICADLPGSGSITTGAWVWTNSNSTGSSLSTSLTGNTPTPVVLSGQASGVRVDRVLFLSDSCIPTGTGDNCTTVDPAPTIGISSPANGATVNGNVIVQSSISDTSRTAKVELLVDGAVVASSTTSPFSITWDSRTIADGSHTLRLRLTDNNGSTSQSAIITVNVANDIGGGGITSRIPIDAYKQGGEGVGYHDTTAGNRGDGTCRNDDVDLKAGVSGCILGWNATGEWLEYDINVAAAGTYTFRINAASAVSTGQFRLDLDGNDISGATNIPNTGSYSTFTTVSKNVNLTAGNHTLRFNTVSEHFDVAWLEFVGPGIVSLGSVVTPPPANDVTSRLPIDAYNSGGEGVGYHDTTAGNLGNGNCRNDDVDLKAGTDGCTLGWFATGEWLEYDVSISAAGDYTLQASVARGESGSGAFRLEVDGSNETGRVDVASTGSWTAFETLNATVTLPAGDHTLRLFSEQQYFDVAWLQFVGPGAVELRSTPPPPPSQDTTPPSQPANIRTTNVTQNSVSLLWDESTDTGSGVVGYAVYRDGQLILAVPSPGYIDSGLQAGATYRYEVSALDAVGNESSRASISVTTEAEPVPEPEGPTADLNADGTFNSQDLAIFKTWYTSDDMRADFDSNGILDVRDWALFLAAWKEGR